MKTTLYSILFSLIAFSISAQGTIQGQVRDANSGEPVLFANVSIFQGNTFLKGTMTDLEGNYKFVDLTAGIFDIEVSSTGCISQMQEGIVLVDGQIKKVDFNLLGKGELEEIVVTESRDVKSKIEISRSAITSDDIRSLPTKSISGMGIAVSGVKIGDISESSMAATSKRSMTFERAELPSSGQMTAGEWNDLHNWKDWKSLLEEEEYGIMTNRFEIFPIERYSVLVVNKANMVLANIPVSLVDKNGETIWSTLTDNAGKAELWANAFSKNQVASNIVVNGVRTKGIKTIEEGTNTIVLDQECYSPNQMDIVFTVDATSSMNDEISYLKSELLDVIERIQDANEEIEFNLGSVFYRDVKDDYLTRVSPLSEDINQTIEFVGNQNSNGGGDHPEAVEVALQETLNLNWRPEALKLVFLILDAPPHEDDETMAKIRSQIKVAALKGIKLIPVTASGIGRETEFLMKFMAIMTNGTYVFITDDSGIGNPHLDPVVKDYEVEKLNDCLVRLISQYSKSYSCDSDIRQENSKLKITVFPNPATQYINIQAEETPDQIKIFSSNGMLVKSVSPVGKSARIEMDDLVNGIYTISIVFGDKVENKQIILIN